MPSITSWSRLEPQVRSDNMQSALQARVYDPLWLLARQWQFGEFRGEDTGSPISARLRGEVTQLTRYWPGPVLALPNNAPMQGKKFDPRQQPLEPLVERESIRLIPVAQAQKLDLRIDAGLHFLRLVARVVGTKHRDLFCQKFPLPALPAEANNADDESLRLAQMMANRAPDGAKIFAASMMGTVLEDPALNQDRAALQPVVEAWAKWYGQLFSEPEGERSAWQSDRQEYAFAVAAPRSDNSETVLTAREYYEGSLEWHSFDIRTGMSLSANTDRVTGQNPAPFVQSLMPAPVTFRGMPAQRFWEFEDATVDLGAIETKPEDLARMLLIEFALSYGNDWFVLPVELPVGSLCQIASLVITDTFGERTLIPATSASLLPAASAWRMYRNSMDRQSSSVFSTSAAPPEFFFLAPTLGKTLEGQPIEEVLFVRDEMANLAWGIERTAEGASGRPVNQREAYLARLQQRPPAGTPPPNADETILTYRLATEVPDYWIPLMPVPLNPQTGAMQFVRRAPARSRILSGVQKLREEEVPREGIRVTRTFQLARWLDGATHLWVGRYKETGRGEASSGLQFDLVEKRS